MGDYDPDHQPDVGWSGQHDDQRDAPDSADSRSSHEQQRDARRPPGPLVAAGVTSVAVLGLGLVLLLTGADDDIAAAGVQPDSASTGGETDGAGSTGTVDGSDRAHGGLRDRPFESELTPEGNRGDAPSGSQTESRPNGDDTGTGNGPATGPDPVVVPDVVGLERSEARTRLSELGLEATIDEEGTVDSTPGTVLRQDPDAGLQAEPGATVRLVVAQAPDEGADLTLELVDCQLVLGGALSGEDAVIALVHTLNRGTAEVTGVVVEVTAASRSSRVSAGITGRDSVIAPSLELREADYTGPIDATLTIDPDDEIAELRRDNNVLNLRIDLPAERPQDDIVPLPCSAH